jgi:hypothetical protein
MGLLLVIRSPERPTVTDFAIVLYCSGNTAESTRDGQVTMELGFSRAISRGQRSRASLDEFLVLIRPFDLDLADRSEHAGQLSYGSANVLFGIDP